MDSSADPTPREADALAWITRYMQDNQRPPTLMEIARGLGIASRGTVFALIERMVHKGLLIRGGRNSPRSLRLPVPVTRQTPTEFLAGQSARHRIRQLERELRRIENEVTLAERAFAAAARGHASDSELKRVVEGCVAQIGSIVERGLREASVPD